MIDIKLWIDEFLKKLKEHFAELIWFVGLQGSYARGEAKDTSDIDMVVILNEVTPDDIKTYNTMLDSLPHRDLACGFLSGKSELFAWEPSDLLSLYYDTNPLIGSLDEIVSLVDAESVNRAIRIGACNIFHGCVHNMLYEKSCDILSGLYKSASFVVQAICLRETGKYIRSKKELLLCISDEEKEIVNTVLNLKNGAEVDFNKMSETLFLWAKRHIDNSK